MKRHSRRCDIERFRDLAGGKPVRPGFHKKPEGAQAIFMSKRGQRGNSVSIDHPIFQSYL